MLKTRTKGADQEPVVTYSHHHPIANRDPLFAHSCYIRQIWQFRALKDLRGKTKIRWSALILTGNIEIEVCWDHVIMG